MAAAAEAEKLRQQGIDIADVTAGEPHFSTPQHVNDAAIAAISGIFRSTPLWVARLSLMTRSSAATRPISAPLISARSLRFGWRQARAVQRHFGAGGARR